MPEPGKQREEILSGIRRSLGKAQVKALAPEAIAAEYAAILRGFAKSSARSGEALMELFAERLLEYEAGVYHATAETIAVKIGEILGRRAKKVLAIPAGLPYRWLAEGFEYQIADGMSALRVDQTEGLLSGCTVAIAETGSIVLQTVPGQGPRKLSLVPDYHLCVVFAEQIVATVPEAFDRLAATVTLPTTFISGPSATADIEMTRIKGVHGPRFLDVLLVG